MRSLLMVLVLVPTLSLGGELDTIFLDEDVIEGNQELPRVLYILPWRELPGEPVRPRAPRFAPGEWLEPVYPDEHRRRLRLREQLKAISKP